MTTLDVENVTEDLKYLGKPLFNWIGLPSEMKRLCIKEMDFKTRTGLRCSSKTERRFIDADKYNFDFVTLELFPKSSTFDISTSSEHGRLECNFKNKKRSTTNLSEDVGQFSKSIEFLKQVLSAKIDYLELLIDSDDRDNKDQKLIGEIITKLPVFSIKKLEFAMTEANTLPIHILKHCDENELTDILINGVYHEEETFFDIPQVINAKKLEVIGSEDGNVAVIRNKVMMMARCYQMYLSSPRIGKMLEIQCFPDVFDTIIARNLGDLVIARHPTEKAVRAMTTDPSLHIWIFVSSRDSHLQMFIVASDSEEPDFKQMDYERVDKPMEELRNHFSEYLAAANFGPGMRLIVGEIGPDDMGL